VNAGWTNWGGVGAWLEQALISAARDNTAKRAIIDIVRTSCLKLPGWMPAKW
jgi:hypothetical protein